jgi:hypothetical protein
MSYAGVVPLLICIANFGGEKNAWHAAWVVDRAIKIYVFHEANPVDRPMPPSPSELAGSTRQPSADFQAGHARMSAKPRHSRSAYGLTEGGTKQSRSLAGSLTEEGS